MKIKIVNITSWIIIIIILILAFIPAAMGESVVVRFRVANPYYGKYLSCYVDGERIAHRKKQIMAPGEMESFTLTREALGESAQEVVFCVEEE